MVFYLTPHTSEAWSWWQVWSPLGPRLTCQLLTFQPVSVSLESAHVHNLTQKAGGLDLHNSFVPGSRHLSIPFLTFHMEWRDVWRRIKYLQKCSPQEWIWDVKERPLWHHLDFSRNPWCWLEKVIDVHFSAGHRTDTGYRIQDTGLDVKVGRWLVEGKTNQLWTSAETTSKWSSFFDNSRKAEHWSQVLIYFQNGTKQFWHTDCLESRVHKSVHPSLKNAVKRPSSRKNQVFSNMAEEAASCS